MVKTVRLDTKGVTPGFSNSESRTQDDILVFMISILLT